MKTLEAVVKMCGDYPAWHETGIHVYYVFGDISTFCVGDWENELDKLGFCWDSGYSKEDVLEKYSQEQLETFIRQWVEDDDGDYCDMAVNRVVKVGNTYALLLDW